MGERSGYKPGEFCWVDLSTTDVDAAASFYTSLLGTESEFAPAGPPEESGGYGFLNLRGKMAAGMGPVQSPDQPPAWSSYIVTADAGETATKARIAGGTVVMGPMDLPMESGRIVVIQDTEGAYISAIELGRHNGAEITNEFGAWRWNLLFSRSLDKASAFYGEVFGWTPQKWDIFPPDFPFWTWHVEGQKWPEGLGGVQLFPPEVPAEVPAHWTVLFGVPDTQEAVDKTMAAGGQVMMPPTNFPVGLMAIMFDPQGAEVAVIQPDPSLPPR